MSTIFMSDAVLNTLIGGGLVFLGTIATPITSFVLSIIKRKMDKKDEKRGYLKPSIKILLDNVFEVMYIFSFIYDKCNGKKLGEVIEDASLGSRTSDFPLNFLQKADSHISEISRFVNGTYLSSPVKIVDHATKFANTGNILVKYMNDKIFDEQDIIKLDEYRDSFNILVTNQRKLLKLSQKYLGVK
ncbi:MAG: hypothetical protein ABII85_01725 [Bacillota bacterium]